jgi:hypothetical protein
MFVSANQQQNAFYTPPSAKANGHAQPIFPPRPLPSVNRNLEKPSLIPEKEKAIDDVDTNEDKGDESEMDHQPAEEAELQPVEQNKALEYSVFNNDVTNRANIEKKSDAQDTDKSMSKPASTSMKRKVPGSFGDDDEDEDMEDSRAKGGHTDDNLGQMHSEAEEEPEHTSGRTARPRQSTSARSTTSNSRKKAKSSKRAESTDSTKPRSRRRAASPRKNLPGALTNEDDHDDEDGGEEEDQVAPLPTTKTRKPGAAGATSTKPISRGSTASDVADELGEGVQPRRRSSRRVAATGSGSGSGHLASVDGDASPRKSTRARKPTVKATRGKKKST